VAHFHTPLSPLLRGVDPHPNVSVVVGEDNLLRLVGPVPPDVLPLHDREGFEDVVDILPAETVEVSVDRIEFRPETSPPLFVPSEGRRGPSIMGFSENQRPQPSAPTSSRMSRAKGRRSQGGVSGLYNHQDFASSRLRVSQKVGGAREDAILRDIVPSEGRRGPFDKGVFR